MTSATPGQGSAPPTTTSSAPAGPQARKPQPGRAPAATIEPGSSIAGWAYGHAAGDQALRTFADRLSAELRAGDIGGRWGGEEFLVVLPRTELDGALSMAERIRSATASEPIVADGGNLELTVSGGCAAGPGDSPAALVHQADTCLYRAKLEGRNRIVTTAD